MQAFFNIDEEFQQLKHHQSHFIIFIITFIKFKLIFTFALKSNSWSLKNIISVAVVSIVFIFISFLSFNESMNLNFIIIIIQDKTLIIFKIKEICNK